MCDRPTVFPQLYSGHSSAKQSKGGELKIAGFLREIDQPKFRFARSLARASEERAPDPQFARLDGVCLAQRAGRYCLSVCRVTGKSWARWASV